MLEQLPDPALHALLAALSPTEWASFACVSRRVRHRSTAALRACCEHVEVDCSDRSWRRQLAWVGAHCPRTASLCVLRGSPRTEAAALQPLLGPVLSRLVLQGFCLTATPLLSLLRERCAALQLLDLQDCEVPGLAAFHALVGAGGPAAPRLRVLNLTGARIHHAGRQLAAGDLPPQPGQPDRRGSGAAPAGHRWRLHLGAGRDASDAWLRTAHSVGDADVIELLRAAGGCEALQALDVSRRASVSDVLLRSLAPACTALRVLDVSLTRVTPGGVACLLQHTPQLRELRYACRCGSPSLDAASVRQLVAGVPQLQIVLARSHKITGAGLEALAHAACRLSRLVLVRCRHVSRGSLKALAQLFPGVSVVVD